MRQFIEDELNVLNDMRPIKTLKSVLYHSTKKGINPWSFNYLRFVLSDKRRCRLFVSFPKSGRNWAIDILTYCIVKKFTGKYDIKYHNNGTLKEREQKPYILFHPADTRSGNQRPIQEFFPQLDIDYCLHTHGYWKASPLWGLDNAKTVFIGRNIPTMLYSYYKAHSFEKIEDVVSKGVLDRAINFYNSWGEFCSKHNNYQIFKYEDFKKNPIKYFGDLIFYVFNLKIGDDLLKEACDYYSIESQKQREYQFCSDESKHFHYKGLTDYSNYFPPELLQYIYTEINAKLRYNFGYQYPGAMENIKRSI